MKANLPLRFLTLGLLLTAPAAVAVTAAPAGDRVTVADLAERVRVLEDEVETLKAHLTLMTPSV